MLEYIFDTLYHLQPPKRVRKDDQPMQVLALGLSRSGTDSLRNALTILGYANVYHGWTIAKGQREDCTFWCPILLDKIRQLSESSDPEPLDITEIDFDSVLGNSEAVTDAPTNVLGKELMLCYPDAKVIINRRRDIEAWHRSMMTSVVPMFGWPLWTLSWFDTSIFWLFRMFRMAEFDYFHGSLIKHGKQGYEEHYGQLERFLHDQKREYLDWSVEEGWAPLCHFLGRPVPDVPFPSGNKGGAQFEMNFEAAYRGLISNALRNIAITLVSLVAVSVAVWKSY